MRSDPAVIELPSQGAETAFDVAEALTVRQLREGHTEKLVPTREPQLVAAGLVSVNERTELRDTDMLHELRKHRRTKVHASVRPK